MNQLNVPGMSAGLLSQKRYPVARPKRKNKEQEDFKTILDSYLLETSDDLDEYRVLIPENSTFHDNGYEDVRSF